MTLNSSVLNYMQEGPGFVTKVALTIWKVPWKLNLTYIMCLLVEPMWDVFSGTGHNGLQKDTPCGIYQKKNVMSSQFNSIQAFKTFYMLLLQKQTLSKKKKLKSHTNRVKLITLSNHYMEKWQLAWESLQRGCIWFHLQPTIRAISWIIGHCLNLVSFSRFNAPVIINDHRGLSFPAFISL